MHDVLAGGLGVRHVVVGYDFRFGHQRAGDVARLAALGEEYDFGLTCVEPVAWRGEVCSSSRVRDAVAAGEVALANDLLGQPFAVEGRVVTGDRRGRELGYPTANLCPPARRALWPQACIYAVRAGLDGQGRWDWQDAVASLGWRPTFGGQDLRLEVHLFDREIDLDGRRLCCSLHRAPAPGDRFASSAELKAQMDRDSAAARAALAAAPPTP